MERTRAARILIWFLVAGVLWIAGGLAEGSTRTMLWLLALAIDYAGPLFTFWVPGLPRVAPSAWELEVSHFAERFQLFLILALGESIVVTGATTAGEELDAATAGGVRDRLPRHGGDVVGVLQRGVARSPPRRLELAENRTQTARDAYTYLHVVMVAGIIVAAVGDELVIAHPDETLHGADIVAVVAGPAIYLLAMVLFRLRMAGTLSRKRLAGAIACVLAGFLGHDHLRARPGDAARRDPRRR